MKPNLIPDAEDAKVTQKTQKKTEKIQKSDLIEPTNFLDTFLFGISSAQLLRLLRPDVRYSYFYFESHT